MYLRYYQPPDISPHARPLLHDPALTAFAQLGVLRIKAQRGVINLSARGREWLLTVVGKNRSVLDDGRCDDPDGAGWPMMGEKKNGLAPKIIELLCDQDKPNAQAVPYVLSLNFDTDERFVGHPVHESDPIVKFFLAFPLRTPRGVIVGTYMLIDDKPRDAIPPDDIKWLANMAVTAMEHLEGQRLRAMQDRSERMIKAMGLFVEGKSTLRDWWMNGGHGKLDSEIRNALKGGRTREFYADNIFGVQEPTNAFAVQGIQNLLDHNPNGHASSSLAAALNNKRSLPRGVSFYSATSLTDSTPEAKTVSETWESNTDITAEDLQAPGTPLPEPVDDDTEDKAQGQRLQEALLTSDLRKAFGRASNLIREAIVLDGCVFFDASIGSFGGGAETFEKPPPAFRFEPSSGLSPSSDDEYRMNNIDAASDEPIHDSVPLENGSHMDDLPQKEPEKCCNVLGFSTRTRSSINSHEPVEELLKFPENVLRRFLKKYPHGKVMNFEDEGCFSSSDSDQISPVSGDAIPEKGTAHSAQRAREKRMSKEAESNAIRAAFPGARSVAFFPLWDNTKERWFSGCFMWSTQPVRVLCPQEDLTYIAAFGNTLMAEVARLSSLAISQMKTDFISSISHELRSPLHGILGSVEFLQDTAMTSMQADMVHTIHSCGKTLLDTINHVLDFSKVNKKVKHHKVKRRKRRSGKGSKDRSSRRGSVGALEDVEDLCTITEEVVESVFAGSSMSKRYPHVRGPHKHSLSDSSLMEHPQPPVQVVLQIPWRSSWNFEVDAGAWRRILMNIVSNALKYTDSGFVRVELGIQNDLTRRSGGSQSLVTITLTDSGKGISKEFLKHHLYTPFMQEDSLASGTGLGMSIVRQIIHDIGGTIDVTSEVGSGTEVRVALPLRASEASGIPEGLSMFPEIREKTVGKKACLVAFNLLPNLGETPTGILSAEDQAIIHLKSSIQNLFQNWFGMEVSTAHDISNPSKASVYIVAESRLPKDCSVTDHILTYSEKHHVRSKDPCVVLVLGGLSKENNFSTRNGLHVIFLQQPYGPHKIGTALHEVFCGKVGEMWFPIREQPEKFEDLDTSAHISPTLQFPTRRRVKISCAVDNSCTMEMEAGPPLEGNAQPSETETGTVPPPPPLPLDKPVAEPLRQPEDEKAVPTDKYRIRRALLVEDNEINLKLLVIYMKKLNIDHVTAVNGLEALNSYESERGQFDIIFMGRLPPFTILSSETHDSNLELTLFRQISPCQ